MIKLKEKMKIVLVLDDKIGLKKGLQGKFKQKKTNQLSYGMNIALKDVVLWLATLAK